MHFTRQPIVETVITPKDGHKIVLRSSKGASTEEFFLDCVEIVSFGSHFFYRSLEKPKSFLLPVGDYEMLQVRDTRMVIKSPSIDKVVKIGSSGKDSRKKQSKTDDDKKAKEDKKNKEEASEDDTVKAKAQETRDKRRDRRRGNRKKRSEKEEDQADETAIEQSVKSASEEEGDTSAEKGSEKKEPLQRKTKEDDSSPEEGEKRALSTDKVQVATPATLKPPAMLVSPPPTNLISRASEEEKISLRGQRGRSKRAENSSSDDKKSEGKTTSRILTPEPKEEGKDLDDLKLFPDFCEKRPSMMEAVPKQAPLKEVATATSAETKEVPTENE